MERAGKLGLESALRAVLVAIRVPLFGTLHGIIFFSCSKQ